jgi:hypothetical protein
LDEFAGAEFRNLASQEIAHIGLMNLESLLQVRLADTSPLDVNQEISPKIGFNLRIECLL